MLHQHEDFMAPIKRHLYAGFGCVFVSFAIAIWAVFYRSGDNLKYFILFFGGGFTCLVFYPLFIFIYLPTYFYIKERIKKYHWLYFFILSVLYTELFIFCLDKKFPDLFFRYDHPIILTFVFLFGASFTLANEALYKKKPKLEEVKSNKISLDL